jgi:hypothetical protein
MKHTLAFLIALLLAPLAAICAAELPPKQPNVVLFLVDDLGWMDCAAYGLRYYNTPHIDAFARQAMRFTDACAMPLCSPTQASILSGKYTPRHGVTSAVRHTRPVKAALQKQASPNSPLLMPESGSYLEPHWPETHGFDVALHSHPDPGPPGGYFSPYGVLPPGSERPRGENAGYVVGNISDGADSEYIVDRQAAEAEKFIDANKDRPLLLNLWCYGVHGPSGHKPEYTAEFATTTDPRSTQRLPTPPQQKIDGVSFAPVLRGTVKTLNAFANGTARVEADGRTPFLGTAQVNVTGPIQLKLRPCGATGGPGKVQCTTNDQTEFPRTGQTVEFTLTAGADWRNFASMQP